MHDLVRVAAIKHGREVAGLPMVIIAKQVGVSRQKATNIARAWGMKPPRVEHRGGCRGATKPTPPGARRQHTNAERRAAALGDSNRRAEMARAYWSNP